MKLQKLTGAGYVPEGEAIELSDELLWADEFSWSKVASNDSEYTITEPHIAEIMLGHVLPIIWRTYDQHDYLEEQREALTKWAERLRQIVMPYPLV